jgi:hypothetical protein
MQTPDKLTMPKYRMESLGGKYAPKKIWDERPAGGTETVQSPGGAVAGARAY